MRLQAVRSYAPPLLSRTRSSSLLHDAATSKQAFLIENGVFFKERADRALLILAPGLKACWSCINHPKTQFCSAVKRRPRLSKHRLPDTFSLSFGNLLNPFLFTRRFYLLHHAGQWWTHFRGASYAQGTARWRRSRLVMVFRKAPASNKKEMVFLDFDNSSLGTSYSTWFLGFDPISETAR